MKPTSKPPAPFMAPPLGSPEFEAWQDATRSGSPCDGCELARQCYATPRLSCRVKQEYVHTGRWSPGRLREPSVEIDEELERDLGGVSLFWSP